MRVAVHQPQYLPWSGLFDKIDHADGFVVLDNVQYQKNEWQNRNRIKTPQGWKWLTVPVHYAFPQRLREVRVAETDWQRVHWRTLTQSYCKAPHFDRYAPLFEPLYTTRWEWLVDLALASMERLASALGVRWAPSLASEMVLADDPNQRLIDICRQMGADRYLAGSGSANYLDLAAFNSADILVEVQQFTQPIYSQLYGPFEPGLSVIDLLFNHGPESLALVRASRGALLQGRLP